MEAQCALHALRPLYTCLRFLCFSLCVCVAGLAYTRGGQGEKVERLYREVRAFSIPAGSEEIMLDLGIRMALKTAAKNFKAKM